MDLRIYTPGEKTSRKVSGVALSHGEWKEAAFHEPVIFHHPDRLFLNPGIAENIGF